MMKMPMGRHSAEQMLMVKYVQSVPKPMPGMPARLIALAPVAKSDMPAAHQGMRWPPRKKSLLLFSRLVKYQPIPIMPSRYAATTRLSNQP